VRRERGYEDFSIVFKMASILSENSINVPPQTTSMKVKAVPTKSDAEHVSIVQNRACNFPPSAKVFTSSALGPSVSLIFVFCAGP